MWARRCFRCNVLRILLSEFNEGQKQTSLGIKERSGASPMSVVMLSTEPNWRTGFVRVREVTDFMIRGR